MAVNDEGEGEVVTTLTLSSHFKLVIYSIHKEEVYRHALAFVDTVEPTTRGGLARAYYDKAGVSLTTLQEVIQALLDGELAT